MRQTAKGNYLWLVLLVFVVIMPIVNAMTRPVTVQPFETAIEQPSDIDLPIKKEGRPEDRPIQRSGVSTITTGR